MKLSIIKYATLSVALLSSLGFSASAQQIAGGRIDPQERRELRADRREIRGDTREIRSDKIDLRRDRRDLRGDVRDYRRDRRSGAS
ncbi:MAG TPA: hypothetical protein VM870_01975, partial [Pyrinomonadaceae bacterium]|nr:hypothetical protein [Pyrinomonadaceae bacterium]